MLVPDDRVFLLIEALTLRKSAPSLSPHVRSLNDANLNFENFNQLAVSVFHAAVSCYDAADHTRLLEIARPGFLVLGFEYFSVMEAVADHGHEGLGPLVGLANEPWQAFYRKNRLHLYDLRIRRARISARSFYCSEVLRDDPQVTTAERDLWVTAARFGLNESYVLPHRTAGGRVFAAVLIGRGRPIDSIVRVATQMLSFEFICAALRLSTKKTGVNGGVSKVILSRREIQCLQLLAAGKNSATIAHELGISHRTVDHYIGDACAKLRVRSRAQAVATAIGLQLIDQP
jgi:DNA-binding CsgD family transcriptional regulator